MNDEIYEQVKGIIVDILSIDEASIDPEDNFREDLGADSLDLVELIMAFEDTFGGRISDDDARQIVTVGDAVDYIENNLQSAA